MSIEDRAEAALVAVAESIGSTIGSIAATATKAKKALTPRASTKQRAKRGSRYRPACFSQSGRCNKDSPNYETKNVAQTPRCRPETNESGSHHSSVVGGTPK